MPIMNLRKEIINEALKQGAFGDLSPLESTILYLRAGGDDPERDLEEIAIKVGQSKEWVDVVEQALLLRLNGSWAGQ